MLLSVSCSEIPSESVYEDGTIYLSGCTVGGNAVDYTYGTEQEIEDIYAYLWYADSHVNGPIVGDDASSLSTSVPSDKNNYLKFNHLLS